MALFKINKGVKANLPSTYTEGYCYFTTDDGKFYIDTTNAAAGRILLNAGKADQLSTARTISLTGDVTGSATFDGSNNISITATVANDSHTHSTYLPKAGGLLTGDIGINCVNSKDRYIHFLSNGSTATTSGSTHNWRIGYTGSGTGNANYLVFDSTKGTSDTWTHALTLGAEDHNATFSGSVTATAFAGSGASLTSLNASNISSGTLAIARGGTGAITAVNACKNLGAMYLDPNDTAISGTAATINAQTFSGMTYAQVKADILNSVVVDDDGQTGVYSVNGYSGNVILNASDVGALPLSGGTLNGENQYTLLINRNHDTYTSNAIGFNLNGSRMGGVGMSGINRPLIRYGSDGSTYSIYDEGNKPTYSDVGAAAASHTHNYLPLSGGTLTGQTIIKGTAGSNPLIIRGIAGSDGNGNLGPLYLNYNNPSDPIYMCGSNVAWHGGNLKYTLSGTILTITTS